MYHELLLILGYGPWSDAVTGDTTWDDLRCVSSGVGNTKIRQPSTTIARATHLGKVADINLSLWGRKLREHLKEFSPRLYRGLQAEGTLNDYCQKIADQASLEMSDLLQSGLPYNQAFELMRDQLYPPPES